MTLAGEEPQLRVYKELQNFAFKELYPKFVIPYNLTLAKDDVLIH